MPAQFPLQQRMRRFVFVCLCACELLYVCARHREFSLMQVCLLCLWTSTIQLLYFQSFAGGGSRPMLNKKRRWDVKASNWSSATVLSRDMHRDSSISSLSAVSDNCCAPSFPCTSVGTAWPHQDWLYCNFQLDTRAPLHTHTPFD